MKCALVSPKLLPYRKSSEGKNFRIDNTYFIYSRQFSSKNLRFFALSENKSTVFCVVIYMVLLVVPSFFWKALITFPYRILVDLNSASQVEQSRIKTASSVLFWRFHGSSIPLNESGDAKIMRFHSKPTRNG